MRKLLIFLFTAVTATLSAQIRLDRPEMYLGANFGVTESMVSFKPAVNQGFLMAYNGGIVFRYIAEKNVGMQIELNYSQRGWTESTGLYSRQLNYIELPFMTHIYMGKKSRFFINLGPKVSYLLSEKVLLDSSGTSDTQHTTSIQNPFDYGLCGGFGFLFNIRRNIIQLDTRANYSISNVFSDKKTDYFSLSNNMNLAVNLAWLFQIK
jgi:hypothetical protein